MTDRAPSADPISTPSSDISADAPVTRREVRLVYAGFMVVMALAALDQSVVATALPRIVSDLGGMAYLSWVVTAYVLASTTVMPLYGKLSDQYGRKPLIYAAVLIFLLGSLLCALSSSMTQLICFRILQGVGAGGLVPLSQIIIGDLVPPRERGRYQGNMGMVYAAATLGGPALGGIITDALSWHWIFLLNLPIGALALVMIALTLKRRHKTTQRAIDYAGAILLMGATSGLLLLLSLGGKQLPWSSPQLIGLVCFTLLATAAFVWRENRAAEPIMPMSLFRHRVFVIAISVVALSFMSSQGASVYFPLFFQVVYDVKMSNSGWLTAPLMIGVVVSARVNGRIVMRTGRYKPPQLIGSCASIVAFVGLTWASLSAQPIWLIEPFIFLMGLSFGLVNPNMVVAVQNAIEPALMGTATAATTFFRSLGGVMGVASCGAILTARLSDALTGAILPGGIDGASLMNGGIVQIQALAPDAQAAVVEIYRHAIGMTFATGIFTTALALGFLILLPELELKSRSLSPDEKLKGDLSKR